MAEYTPNSQRSKEQAKKVEKPNIVPVVTSAKRKKPNEFKRFLNAFMAMDYASLKDCAIHQILIPNGKKIIMDILDIALNGESGTANSRRAVNASKYDYGSCYNNQRQVRSQPVRRRYSYDEIVLTTASDAEKVIRELQDIIGSYDCVAVGQFLEMVNERGCSTDYNYGWYNLDNVSYHRVSDGWVIDLPKPTPLGK